MNTLRQAVQEYLSMRRNLGFVLRKVGNGLLDFVTFMEQRRASYITQTLALDWGATTPKGATCAVGRTIVLRARICAVSQCDRFTHADSTAGLTAVPAEAAATVPVLG